MTSEPYLKVEDAKKCLQEHLRNIGDIERRELKNEGEHALLIYLKSMCDPIMINENLINRFYELKSLDLYDQFLRSFPSTVEPKDEQELLRNILRRVAVFLRDSVLLFDAVLVNAGAIQPASTENVIQGPDDSFTENIEVNLNLIRHRYQTANLKRNS